MNIHRNMIHIYTARLTLTLVLVQHLPLHSLYFYNLIICATILKHTENNETEFLASVSNFPSLHFNVIIKYAIYIYRKHNVVSHKHYVLRPQMADEKLGALAVCMNYCIHCNCFPSFQKWKCWHPGIMKDHHDPYCKSAKLNSGKSTCCHCWYVWIWFKNVPCLSALGSQQNCILWTLKFSFIPSANSLISRSPTGL